MCNLPKKKKKEKKKKKKEKMMFTLGYLYTKFNSIKIYIAYEGMTQPYQY